MMKQYRRPEVRVGFYVPQVHVMDYFNMTFAPRKTARSVRRAVNYSPEPKVPRKLVSLPPTIRSRSVMKSHKHRDSPKRVVAEEPLNGSQRLGFKALQQTLTPINLAFHLEPELVRSGQRVLAGRFQQSSIVSTLTTDPALEGLESRLTVLLQGKEHRRLMSQ